MYKYILKRLIMMIPVIVGVVTIVFIMNRLTPGNPARQLLGEDASEEAVEAMEEELGLNDPILVQYVKYVWNIVTKGDFGISYQTKQPVITEVLARFPTTFMLALVSMALRQSSASRWESYQLPDSTPGLTIVPWWLLWLVYPCQTSGRD